MVVWYCVVTIFFLPSPSFKKKCFSEDDLEAGLENDFSVSSDVLLQ